MVRLPEPTQDQNPLGDTSTIRESQPARDLARSGQAAQRRGWHEGHGKAGVSVATGPHSPEAHPPRSPSAAATAPAAAGLRWRPPQLSPLPPPLSPPRPIPPHLLTAPGPPPHPRQQENQHKPRSITAATRASSRSPSGGREAGDGRPQAGRGESGARLPLRPTKVCPGGRRRWPESCLGWRCRVPGASGAVLSC